MRKQILTIGLVALVASSSVYAFGGFDKGSNCGGKTMNKSFMKSKGDSIHSVMGVVSDMDLTQEQWKEIKLTMLDMKKSRLEDRENRPTITFNKDGSFDKEKFIAQRSSFSKHMIESQVTIIEKITSILDESEKKILVSKLNNTDSFKRGCKK